MSVIVVLCEDPCPIHDGMLCLLEKGHVMPHKGALKMPRERSTVHDSIVVEWRPVDDESSDAAGSVETWRKRATSLAG